MSKSIEFKTPNKMYVFTTVVVTEECLTTGYAPTGAGDDYKLSKREIEDLKALFSEGVCDNCNCFTPDKPYLVRANREYAKQAFEKGSTVYLSKRAQAMFKKKHDYKCMHFTILRLEDDMDIEVIDHNIPYHRLGGKAGETITWKDVRVLG